MSTEKDQNEALNKTDVMQSVLVENLRIGNYLLDDTSNDVMVVEKIETRAYTDWNNDDEFNIICSKLNDKGGFFYQGNFRPIPLTEEWMLKFGFEKRDDGNYNVFNFSEVDIIISKDFSCWKCDGIVFSLNQLNYVHELQNLFWILDRTALTVA